MRRCFIHIGTHKTGTTTLQTLLSQRRVALRSHNYLYPSTGRPPQGPAGHHNLAWEISGDRRFRKEYGTLEDLLWIVDDTGDDILLSSEDFECSVYHTPRFDDFLQRLRAAHLETTIVVYLRDQVTYASSLYFTLITLGLTAPFEVFLEDIQSLGRFCWREWIFPFDYISLLNRIEHFGHTKLVVRSYDRLQAPSLVDDFLSILGLTPEAVGVQATLVANPRPPLHRTLIQFLRSRGGPLSDAEQSAVDRFCEQISGRIEMSVQNQSRIARRFHASNSDILSKYGVACGSSTMGSNERSAQETPSLETLFSEELEMLIRGMKRTGGASTLQ